jgi:hypothetical protein
MLAWIELLWSGWPLLAAIPGLMLIVLNASLPFDIGISARFRNTPQIIAAATPLPNAASSPTGKCYHIITGVDQRTWQSFGAHLVDGQFREALIQAAMRTSEPARYSFRLRQRDRAPIMPARALFRRMMRLTFAVPRSKNRSDG